MPQAALSADCVSIWPQLRSVQTPRYRYPQCPGPVAQSGQSSGLIIRWLQVQVLPGPQTKTVSDVKVRSACLRWLRPAPEGRADRLLSSFRAPDPPEVAAGLRFMGGRRSVPFSNPSEEVLVSFGEAVATCFRKYATFSGRARPSEFWWWVLFLVILWAVIGAVAGAAGSIDEFGDLDSNAGAAALLGVVSLGLILPNLAVAVRRLHDTGRSGWFLFLGLIPCIGGILLLVFYASAGDPGPNKFGPPPASPV